MRERQDKVDRDEDEADLQDGNIGALTIRIGFWGLLCHNSNKEPPN